MQYAVICSEKSSIFKDYPVDCMSKVNSTEIVDEILSGWVVYFERTDIKGLWCRVTTDYGYVGIILICELREISLIEIAERSKTNSYMRINVFAADILSEPQVHATIIDTLLQNSIVKKIQDCSDGWTKIKTANGYIGYIHAAF